MNLNKVMLAGNLTRDPELRYLPSQTALVEFGLAVNRKWKTPQGEDKEETLFVDCSAFGKPAEVINQYCQKGKGLFVEGRLKFDTWEDKNGGGKRSKLSVVVENFQFIGGREGSGGDGGNGGHRQQQRGPGGKNQGAPTSIVAGIREKNAAKGAPPPIGNEEHFKEDDIPFTAPAGTSRRRWA